MFKWASGNKYSGGYKDDERDGYGEMYWVDGSVYKGEWRKGIQHGQGTMEFPDGTLKEGFFENNVFVGKAYNLTNKQETFSDRTRSAIRDSQVGLSIETTPVRNSTKQPLPLGADQQ